MSEAIIFGGLTVNCDHCEFQQEIERETFMDWHNKECPECGKILVDDGDIKAYQAMHATVDLINAVAGDVKEGHRMNVQVDSAGLKPDKPSK